MDSIVPWSELEALIAPHSHKPRSYEIRYLRRCFLGVFVCCHVVRSSDCWNGLRDQGVTASEKGGLVALLEVPLGARIPLDSSKSSGQLFSSGTILRGVA